jgi:hypothetical protein
MTIFLEKKVELMDNIFKNIIILPMLGYFQLL